MCDGVYPFEDESSILSVLYKPLFPSLIFSFEKWSALCFMDSLHAMSSANNACSFIADGNLWRGCCASKASQYKTKTQIEYNLVRFQQSSLNNRHKWIEGGPTYQECNKKYVGKAISRPHFDSEPQESNSKNILDSVKNFFAAFYWFCYPYSVIGSALSTISTSLLVVDKLSDISPLFIIGVLQALIPYFFMDIYVNGVNQLCDLEIDKINKPYLPLASGQISFTTGVIMVASSLTLSFGLAWTIGSWPLIWGLVSCFLLWTAYSINTFVLKRATIFPRSLIFVAVFMGFYSLGIALFKDIPDIDGDKAFGIQSFSARLGQKRGLGYLLLASILWYQAKFVDLSSKASIGSFYMLIWKVGKIIHILWSSISNIKKTDLDRIGW
ncbi:unnamed protein product, partial [Sphenostylis stenocarpa]